MTKPGCPVRSGFCCAVDEKRMLYRLLGEKFPRSERTMLKRIASALLLLLLFLPAAVLAQDSPVFAEFLESELVPRGWTIQRQTACGQACAAIMSYGQDGDPILTDYVYRDGRWLEQHSSADVLRFPYAGRVEITLDTEELLILSFIPDDTVYTPVIQQYYRATPDGWKLDQSVEYMTDREWNCVLEWSGYIRDGYVCSDLVVTDENDNIKLRRQGARLPDVLAPEDCLLQNVDNRWPPFTAYGYQTDERGQLDGRITEQLFRHMLPDAGTYVDACWQTAGRTDAELLFLADRGGRRHLLCGFMTDDDEAVWSFTDVTVPDGTVFGVENFDRLINLGGSGLGVGVNHHRDGTWGLNMVLSGEGGLFLLGSCWTSTLGLWGGSEPAYMGTAPWRDITDFDWQDTPRTPEQAAAMLVADGWATPNSANREDRLHLRAKADKGSTSLGKYYNGTPVKVLNRGKEWTKVRVGGREGYMMTKYLAFGAGMAHVDRKTEPMQAVELLTHVVWEDADGCIQRAE